MQHASFTELATYALDCLTTPISNAVVERIFSMVSGIKTKPRNRMELGLLDAIVRIRSELLLQEKHCKDFFYLPYLSSIHEKAMYCYVLNGKSALAWELLFPGHLSST